MLDFRNAECRYAECRYTECRYAESCYTDKGALTSFQVTVDLMTHFYQIVRHTA